MNDKTGKERKTAKDSSESPPDSQLLSIHVDSLAALVNYVMAHKARFASLNAVLDSDRHKSPTAIEILASAIQVFNRKGIEKTTVQDLIEAAGISRRTFYKYFSNKQDVAESLYRTAIDLMVIRFQSVAGEACNLEDVVNRSVDIYFEYHGVMGSIIRMMQESALSDASPLASHRRVGMVEVSQVLNSEIFRLEGKRFDPLVTMSIMWNLESASLHLLKDTSCTPEDIAHYKDVMKQVILGILKAAKPIN